MNYLKSIENDFKNISDLVIKPINNVTLIYIDSICNQSSINDFILKNLVNKNSDFFNKIPAPNLKIINNYDELKNYLLSGFSIIIDGINNYAIETKGNITRSIDTPKTEPTIYGPKDALTENIQTNLGLIRRRLKTNHLKNDTYIIGKYSNTILNILYIKTIVKEELVNKIKHIIKNINIDGINDITELKKYFKDNNIFPSFKITERPDLITSSLLNGKIVILLDNSPYALIIPSFLADFINPISDKYEKSININFLKIIRLLCFIIAIITPGLYIALTTFNQETIPTPLLISIQNQRINVPFPSIIECLITLFTCEILRESDIRFPSNYGSAISILGALILGQAAVDAGIVSPIMIIVVALTFMASLIFTDLEMISAIRQFRILFLLAASILGLYGISICFIFLILYLTSYENMNMPYMYPISPFDLSYLKETLLNLKNNKRSKLLSKNSTKGDL